MKQNEIINLKFSNQIYIRKTRKGKSFDPDHKQVSESIEEFFKRGGKIETEESNIDNKEV